MSDTTPCLHCHNSVKCADHTSVKTSTESTVNKEEVKKFQEMAHTWWNPTRGLHIMNAFRVPIIRDGILQVHSAQSKKETKPLTGFNILDVGCGGGILAEPLARLGAEVTGLDPGEESIKVAQYHCSLDPEVRDNLEYICSTVEEHCKGSKKYDVVVCSEVIEHVDNVPYFVKCCTDLVKNDGSIFFTTINRTAFSYIHAIFFAERVLGVIPRGTHDWNKFIRPNDLKLMLQSHGFKTVSVHGAAFTPFKTFVWIPYQGGFYALHAVREVIPVSTDP